MSNVLTRHAMVRCQQRGFRGGDLDLVLALGSETECGVFFGRREADEIISRLKQAIRRVERLKDTWVVAEGGTVVTAYKKRGRIAQRRRS